MRICIISFSKEKFMYPEREIVSEPEDFDIQLPDRNSLKIYAEDFGIIPGDDDIGEALQAAINHCTGITPCTLVISKGEYGFSSGNHPVFSGIDNFTLEGNGSEFTFSTQKNNFFTIRNCHQILFQNLNIDWDWSIAKLASIGKVISIAQDLSSFEMEFQGTDSITTDMDFQCFTPLHKTNHTIGFCDGKEFGRGHLNGRMEQINDKTIRFYIGIPAEMSFLGIGQLYMARHYVYGINAFSMSDNSNLTLKNLTIFSAPGHAFTVNGHQHHWQLLRCRLTKKPGTDRCISVTADGHHVANSNGYFKMENCDFGFNGDDCVNIHSNSKMGYTRISERTIRLQSVNYWKNPFEKGNIIEFRYNDLSPTGYSYIVEDAVWDTQGNEVDLILDRALFDGYVNAKIIFNLSYQSDHYILRNNFFHQNRARGVLASSNYGIIEKNRFFMNMGPALQMECGCEERWAEGYGISDVIIRNNYFDTCDTSHWSMACIYLGCYLPYGRTDYPIFRNIAFENNTIINMPGAAVYLSSCKDVSFSNNTLINVCTKDHITGPELYSYNVDKSQKNRYQGAIILNKAMNCDIRNNKLIYTVPVTDRSIYATPQTTEGITIADNQGFLLKGSLLNTVKQGYNLLK